MAGIVIILLFLAVVAIILALHKSRHPKEVRRSKKITAAELVFLGILLAFIAYILSRP